MTEFLQPESLRASFDEFLRRAEAYFVHAMRNLELILKDGWHTPDQRDYYWDKLDCPLQDEATESIRGLLAIAGPIGEVVRNASLVTDADRQEVIKDIKVMRAALHLRHYKCWGTDVLHDEGTVLGVQSAGQSENLPLTPEEALRSFAYSAENISNVLDLVVASRNLGPDWKESAATRTTHYRSGTAFIMMWMDKEHPELADTADTVKRVFRDFGINAVRADDIEHEGVITKRIQREIETAEFLFADLTGERPNVYYEVGYAHALKRSVILYRKNGTNLHFDLGAYNCPEYENNCQLRAQLTGRLEAMTNRKPALLGEK